jgi:2-C-methyl-D-erythritol 4-phosphate cytidylyltransferase
VAGKRVLDWSLEAARACSDGVVLVVARECETIDEPLASVIVVGGATRSASVRRGLAAVPGDAEVVVVHDSARPAASAGLFERVIVPVKHGEESVIPVIPVVDTIKRIDEAVVVETLDRSTLVAVQTPQAFRAEVLRRAHELDADGTDDAALVEAIGGRVVVVDGDPRNIKVTTPDDLARVASYLGE